VEQNGEMLKVFKTHFTPPQNTEKVWTLIFEACSPKVNSQNEDVQLLPQFMREPLIDALNNKLA
jgi:hypothetical protein